MTLKDLREIIEDRYLDIVSEVISPSPEKLRLILNDKSFIDLRLSRKIKGRFDFHWERRHINGKIYRYDNFPNTKFKKLKTFPYHFHKEREEKVIEWPFRKKLPDAFIDFIEFVKSELIKK